MRQVLSRAISSIVTFIKQISNGTPKFRIPLEGESLEVYLKKPEQVGDFKYEWALPRERTLCIRTRKARRQFQEGAPTFLARVKENGDPRGTCVLVERLPQ